MKSVKSLHRNRTNACRREPDKHECLQNPSSLFCSNKHSSTVTFRCPTISTLIAEPDTVKQELSLTSKEQNHKILFPYLEHDWLQEGNQQLLPQQSKNRTWESPQRFWRTELLWSPVSSNRQNHPLEVPELKGSDGDTWTLNRTCR